MKRNMAEKKLQPNNSKGSLRRIKALIVKEFIQIIYDPSSILICIFLPLLLLFLYGYGVSLDLDHLHIGLVLEDHSPDAQSFAKSMTDSRYFEVKIARDRRELLPDLMEGSIRGIVVIPSYFSNFRLRQDKTAPIQVIADGSEPNTANFVQNYVAQTWSNWLQQEKISNDLHGLPRIDLQTRFWYNEELESRNFLIPGSLAIIMTLIGTLLTALVIAREWERGTMEALMSTPVTIVEILIGKLVPYFILGMVSMGLCVYGSILIYHVPFRGSGWLLAFVTACFLTTALGLGLLISTLARNQLAASQAALVAAFLPAYILSGFIFEIGSMPLPIRLITYIVPARYFVKSLLTIFLVGNVWEVIIFSTLPMLGIGALLFFIVSRKLVKRLD
jgi:ABC-2 type transport system permease protein